MKQKVLPVLFSQNLYKQFSFNQVFMPKLHAIECTQQFLYFSMSKQRAQLQHNVCLKLLKPVSISIKGIVAWDFGLLDFSQSHRSGLPIHILKYFLIRFQFAEVFEFNVSLMEAIQVFCDMQVHCFYKIIWQKEVRKL